METTKSQQKMTATEMQKEISNCWKELYEQKKIENERLEAENRELRHKCYELSRNIERLAASQWNRPVGF